MTVPDFRPLAVWNAERARGIVHTPEWDAKMADLQREFDAAVEAEMERYRQPDGTAIIPVQRLSTPVLDALERIGLRRRG